MMHDLLFYLFAAMALGCGFLVVANPFSRSPVTSAMFLVLTILALAGLFVLVHAFFLAAVQVIVYAGAVMVLFVFVIMLLDLRAEERRRVQLFGVITGLVSVGAITAVLAGALLRHRVSGLGADAEGPSGTTLATLDFAAHARDLGRRLFTDYLLPFEMLSVLLLVAMVGVILLSKKDLK